MESKNRNRGQSDSEFGIDFGLFVLVWRFASRVAVVTINLNLNFMANLWMKSTALVM